MKKSQDSSTERLVELATQMVITGSPRQEIEQALSQQASSKLTKSQIQKIYEAALDGIRKGAELDLSKVQAAHLVHYENIFAYFNELGLTDHCQRTLKAKERLLTQMGKAASEKPGSNGTGALPKQGHEYDLTKLTPEQQKRLNFLITKGTK